MGRLKEFTVKMPYQGKITNLPPYALPPQAFSEMYNFSYNYQKTPGLIPGWLKFDAVGLSNPVMLLDQFFLYDGTDFFIGISTSTFKHYNTATGVWDDKSAALTGDYTYTVHADIWPQPKSELYVFTNGKDTIKKWTGNGNVAALGGLTDVEPGGITVNTAKCIRTFEDFVVLIHTTEDGFAKPFRIRWGKKGTPETWKNDTNGLGQAGFTDLLETTDWAVVGERLNYYMVIYKERSIYFMEYVGSPTVMRFNRFIDGVGILGSKCVANMGDYHILVGNDNFYELTASSFEPIGDAIKDEFFGLLNPERHEQVRVFMAEEVDEIIVAFPSTASNRPDKFYIYNFAQKSWSGPHDRACTCFGYYQGLNSDGWDDIVGVWSSQTGYWDERIFQTNAPLNMMGDNSGYVYELYNGIAADGPAINGYLAFGLSDLGLPNNLKRLQKVYASVESATAGSIKLYVGYTDNPDNDVSWYGPVTGTMKGRTLEFDIDVTAVYFMLKFTTSDGIPFRLLGHSYGFIPRSSNR